MNQLATHEGDVAQWMIDLLDGKDTLKVWNDVCVSVVCGQPPYPANTGPAAVCEGNPISGLDAVWDDVHPCSVMLQKGPIMRAGKVVDGPCHETTGPYVLVVTGSGATVSKARDAVYKTVKEIRFPNMMYRTDIGASLEEKIPKLHRFGYATQMKF
jgi:phosphoribosylamine--glycine ligase